MDLTRALALYGAATGTVALLLAAIGGYNNLKDRPWLRLRFRIVVARHGRIQPGLRHVIVDLSNVGRRRALAYPPLIEYLTASWERVMVRSPDEAWEDGAGWTLTSDSGEPDPLVKIAEYEGRTYLYELPPLARLVRVRVTDSLERRKTRYTFLGFMWLNLFRVRRLVRRGRSSATVIHA